MLIRVRYRVVTESHDGVWNVLRISRANSSLLPSDISLKNHHFYEVTVDARTEAGFNDSLDLQSIILPTAATGSNDSVQY